MFQTLLNLLYPPRCAFCRELLEPDSKEPLCGKCRLSLRYCAGQLCCKKCGKPVPSLGEKGLCLSCLEKRRTGYDRIISALEYGAPVRRSISAYKGDRPQRQFAGLYARMMRQMIDLEYSGLRFDLIIGVPPSRRRMRTKNFDHIAHLCRQLSKETGIPFLPRCLAQIGSPRKQNTLSYQERAENLIGSIRVRRGKEKALDGAVCLLTDDICTTGSTLDECARVLKKAGAKQVYAVTLATVPKHSRL